MADLVIITPPAIEPVSLDDMLQQLGYGPALAMDSATLALYSGRLSGKIVAARVAVENYLRMALITQTLELRRDGFPGIGNRYNRNQYESIMLPRPPFQAMVSFQYVDTTGTLQALTLDSTYGNSTSAYAYQLDPGSDGQPARLLPAWARPWPPTRLVPNNVLIQYVAGYGLTGDSVPAPILDAIKMMAQFLYQGWQCSPQEDVPSVVSMMLGQYRNLIS